MKKLLFSTLLLSLALVAAAQLPLPKEEIAANRNLSASNTVAYPTPTQKLSPAPAGKKPFYISHYGRHGSRYLTKIKDYDYAMETLKKADEAGKLTELGRDVLRRVKLLHDEAYSRWGDLTPLGGQQSKEIIARMMANFPEVFGDGAFIRARSSVVPRCAASMQHFVHALTASPSPTTVDMRTDSADMAYIAYTTPELHQLEQRVFPKMKGSPQRFIQSLFHDPTAVAEPEKLLSELHTIASDMQDIPLNINLYEFFTDEEFSDVYDCNNERMVFFNGDNPLNGLLQGSLKDVARLGRVQLLGQLLGDGAAAASAFLAHEHTLDHGTEKGLHVDTRMTHETGILGGNQRFGQILGQLVKIHIHAVSLRPVVTPHFLATGSIDGRCELVGGVFQLVDGRHVTYHTVIDEDEQQ